MAILTNAAVLFRLTAMETLKQLSGVQKFLIGLLVGLIAGWGGTYAALKQAAWGADSCGPGESTVDCLERLAKETATDSKDTKDVKTDVTGTTPTSGTPEITTKKPDAVAVSGTNAVSVDDQPAGVLVSVTMLTLSQPGWIAVREVIDGVSGNILGAHRYDPGLYLAEVELLRPTVAGHTYRAELFIDNGDKQFDLATDAPIKNDAGIPIADSFIVQ